MTTPATVLSSSDLMSIARYYAGRLGSSGRLQIESALLPGRSAVSLLAAPGGGPAMQAVAGTPVAAAPNTTVFVARMTGTFSRTPKAPAGEEASAPTTASSALLLIDANSGTVVASRIATASAPAVPELNAVDVVADGTTSVGSLMTTALTAAPSILEQIRAEKEAQLENPQAGPAIGPGDTQ